MMTAAGPDRVISFPAPLTPHTTIATNATSNGAQYLFLVPAELGGTATSQAAHATVTATQDVPNSTHRTRRPLNPAAAGAGHAREKQFRVESDVRCSAVCGHTVWLGHNDGTVSIRETRTAEVVRHFNVGNQARVWSMITVNNAHGTFVWIGLSNGDIEVHAVTTEAAQTATAASASSNAATNTATGHNNGSTHATPRTKVAAASITTPPSTGTSLFGARAASATGDTPLFVRRLARHTGGVHALAEFGGQVFSGSTDFQVMQWDSLQGSFVRQLTGHANYVRCLYAEGSLLLSGSDDHTIRVWNVVTGQTIGVRRFHQTGVSVMCRVGVHIWSGDDSGRVVVWSMQTLEAIDTLHEHRGRVSAMKKIGARVFTGGADHDIVLFDANTRSVVTRLFDHRGWILGLACPAQLCRYYVWSMGADGTVRCWHHDEYRVMSAEAERYDDMRWFHAESTPHRDLNASLCHQLGLEEAKSRTLASQFAQAVAAHDAAAASNASLIVDKDALMADLEATKTELDVKTKIGAQHDAVLSTKETQLAALTAQLKESQACCVDLRCSAQRTAAELEEARRSLEIAKAERDKLRSALDQTLEARRGEGGVVPAIVLCEGDAPAAVQRLSADLVSAGVELESLRREVARFRLIWSTTASATNALSPGRRGRSPGGASTARGVSPRAAVAAASSVVAAHVAGLLTANVTGSGATATPPAPGALGLDRSTASASFPTAGAAPEALFASTGASFDPSATQNAIYTGPTAKFTNPNVGTYLVKRYFAPGGPLTGQSGTALSAKPQKPATARPNTGRVKLGFW